MKRSSAAEYTYADHTYRVTVVRSKDWDSWTRYVSVPLVPGLHRQRREIFTLWQAYEGSQGPGQAFWAPWSFIRGKRRLVMRQAGGLDV